MCSVPKFMRGAFRGGLRAQRGTTGTRHFDDIGCTVRSGAEATRTQGSDASRVHPPSPTGGVRLVVGGVVVQESPHIPTGAARPSGMTQHLRVSLHRPMATTAFVEVGTALSLEGSGCGQAGEV